MKRLHRVFMWFYDIGYTLWLKIGKKMYWDDVMLVREVDADYFNNKIDNLFGNKIARWDDE